MGGPRTSSANVPELARAAVLPRREILRPGLQSSAKTRTMRGVGAGDSVRRPGIAHTGEESTMNPYSSLCDDFGVYVYLNSKMELPSGRETILHFFDSL